MSGCRHQFVGEAVCEHCGIYEHAHLVEKIERLTRERDEARRERDALRAEVIASNQEHTRTLGHVLRLLAKVKVGEPLQFSAPGAFDDLDKDERSKK